LTILPFTTPLLRNIANCGEGETEVLTRLDGGSAACFAASPCLEETFLLGIGGETGDCFDGGLVSVEACSILRTGEA